MLGWLRGFVLDLALAAVVLNVYRAAIGPWQRRWGRHRRGRSSVVVVAATTGASIPLAPSPPEPRKVTRFFVGSELKPAP